MARCSRRRRAWTPIAAAVAIAAACSGDPLGPTIDCDTAVGVIFVEFEPTRSGTFADYAVDVGDSIRVTGSLRRVDASEERFNQQHGWSCTTTASSPVTGTVSLSTADTTIVRLQPGGWIRGLQAGLALVTASSASPVASADFGVLVRSP